MSCGKKFRQQFYVGDKKIIEIIICGKGLLCKLCKKKKALNELGEKR